MPTSALGHCVYCALATAAFLFVMYWLVLPGLALPCLALSSGASTVLYCTQSALDWTDKQTDNSLSIYLSILTLAPLTRSR